METNGHGESVSRAAGEPGCPSSSPEKKENDSQCRLSSETLGSRLPSIGGAAVGFRASDAETEATPVMTAAVQHIRCVPAGDQHAQGIATLMEVFLNTEPLLTAASAGDTVVGDADFRPRLEAWTRSLIRRGLSVVALENSDGSHNDGAVVGTLLNFIAHRDAEKAARDDEAATVFSVCLPCPATIAIEAAIAHVEAEADMFGRLKADEMMVLGYASVSPHRRGGGILSRLVSASEALAAQRGLRAVVSAASSAFTQSALSRLGYEELASAEFTSLLDPALFDLHKMGPHRRSAVLGKRLSTE